MSTTVTYKGETLTTVSNETVVLETEGTWVEDDITLTDTTSGGTMQAKSNIDPTTSSQTIEPDEGYDGLSSVQINAMPTGTAGTPTATKGAVSNHSISVTPSVTNSAGYISSGTINGTAVSVTASELDSGAKSITANGNSQDVVGYASVDVNVPNTYAAGDEGKVVSSGALVSQTAHADVTPTTSDQTIDTTTNNSIKVKGDANLVAGNIKKDVEIFGTTGSYEGGGGGISVDDIATNTAPSGAVTLSNTVTVIKDYAFSGKPITSIVAPAVIDVKMYALQNTSITTINDTSFPVLGGTNEYQILLRMNSLKYLKLSGEKLRLDSGSYALRDNANLETLELPNATKSIANSGQRGTNMYALAFCSKLTLADLGYITGINAYCFNNDALLSTIVLRNTSIVTLSNVSAFNGTPFRSGGTGGTIYIPKTLYDHLGDNSSSDYQHASNWSTVHGYGTITWAKIEGSIYE